MDSDYSNIVYINNVGSQTADFNVKIYYSGGTYILEAQRLEAGKTATFDIKKLRDEQLPDKRGNTIPRGATVGQFSWSMIHISDETKLVGRSEVVSRSRKVDSSYSCPICCPNTGPAFNPEPVFLAAAGGFYEYYLDGFWYDCYGRDAGTTAESLRPVVAAPNIASAAMEQGLFSSTGYNPGATTWDATYWWWFYQDDGMDCYDFSSFGNTGGPIDSITVTDVTAVGATKITQVTGNQDIIHFVTPKGASNSQVTLTATLSQSSPQILSDISWDGATESSTNPLQATVTKDSAKRETIRIKYRGTTLRELRVWVVWATISSTPIALTYQQANLTTGDGNTYLGAHMTGGYNFTHSIQPTQIITDSNRPNLSGTNTVAPPGGNHPVFGTPLARGANKKWDNSRQLRWKVLNPNSIPSGFFLAPVVPSSQSAYPTNDAEGNDDRHPDDETNDPYANNETLTGTDSLSMGIANAAGSNNDTYEERIHFREFTRLEIQGQWFRISDYYLWRIHFKLRKTNGVWGDDGSSVALDNGGFN
jgi:hypothetical protein